jgi:hypothetical protein
LVRSLYKLASRADHDNAAREQIQSIVSQFTIFQQIETPLQRAFENAGAVAAEREAMLEAANIRASIAEERVAVSIVETDSQRVQIVGLERDRDDLAGALEIARVANNTLQETLREREAALVEISRRVDDLAAASTSTTGRHAAIPVVSTMGLSFGNLLAKEGSRIALLLIAHTKVRVIFPEYVASAPPRLSRSKDRTTCFRRRISFAKRHSRAHVWESCQSPSVIAAWSQLGIAEAMRGDPGKSRVLSSL